MPDAVTTAFASWNIPPWATLSLVVTAVLYVRGWRQIRITRPEQFPIWRLISFVSGLFVIWIAIASPLDSMSGMLLVVHMTQHLLLMSLAPPLIALGAPMVPLLRGLPRFFVREGLGPFFSLRPVHAVQRLFKSRVFAWFAMNLAFVLWHVPAAYDLALRHPGIHEVEHACFFATSLLFWWPIIEPWPTVYKGSRWMLLPYLMSADIINTALSAFLSFSGEIVYPIYSDAPRLFGLTALSDQVAAGSLMWVLGSTAFLGPIMWITLRMLSRRGERRAEARAFAKAQMAGAAALAMEAAGGGSVISVRAAKSWSDSQPRRAGFDLLALPPVSAFLKSRYGRQSIQAVTLMIASAIIVDGLFGHQMGSMNLAGIVPWTYGRALFVLALLLVGNLFCMSCPFTLPREFAKWLGPKVGLARLPWPLWLRGKWLSAALVLLFFWAYEAMALWNAPMRTAVLLLGYFATCFAIDSVFRGASFCKYVCPLGQFNFVASLVSPVGLAAREQATCSNCSTRDCISGNEKQRGCELDLFMPAKSGNMDCTLCMDCVKACPHDNIGLFVQAPAQQLVQLSLPGDLGDPQRSSVGRYSRRSDIAAVALVVISASFGSAAVMVVPVANWLDRMSQTMPGWLAPAAGLALASLAPTLLLALVLAAVRVMQPRLARGVLAAAGTLPEDPSQVGSLRGLFCHWTLALLPIGLAMWAAHLSFHLVTAWNSVWPALLQAGHELHMHGLATPDWMSEQSLLGPDALLQLQLGLLDAGLLGTLYIGWRMVRRNGPLPARRAALNTRPGTSKTLPSALITLAPWALVVLCLYAVGVWILLEPMQMRGMVGM